MRKGNKQIHTGTFKDRLSAQDALNLERVPLSFYRRRALEVAPDLLGLVVVRNLEEGVTAGYITECEAYEGPEDRACHAYNGLRTRRNQALWGPPGHAYVYFTYGMHYLFNTVTMKEDVPHGVLIRSLKPVTGLDIMAGRRRGMMPLTKGPGRLSQAMAIGRRQNGTSLQQDDFFLGYPPEGLVAEFSVETTPRIGIDYAGEARDYPWRFTMVPKSE